MKKIIAYLHTHWDREWYREFEEFRLRLIEVIDDIVNKLQSGEIPEFYFDGQTSAIEDYLEIFPEKLDTIKTLIKDKKLYVGPFYCSADQFLTNGESLLRNLFIGIKQSHSWGEKDFIAYLSDTFGHCISMNEILNAANLKSAILWRGIGNLPADILWNGIKTTNLIQGYFNDFLNSNMNFNKKSELLKKYIDKIAAKSGDYILLPIGADHLKVCDNLSELIDKLNEKYKNEYEIIISNPFEYFNKTLDIVRTEYNGEFLDNSLTFILQGIYSTRMDIKQLNARCERKLNQAEMFNAVNSFFLKKKSYQKQIDYAYKTLIKNHAHDSIYGCSTDKVCREVVNRFEKVEEIADGITKRCIRDVSNEKGFSVVNLSNSEYEGITFFKTNKILPDFMKAIEISREQGFPDDILYDTNKIPVTEDYTDIVEYAISLKKISEFSYKKITKNDINNENSIKSTKNSLENEYFNIKIVKNKINIIDKKHKKLYKDFFNFIDVGDVGDSYNFAPLKGDKAIMAKIKSFEIINEGFIGFLNIKFQIKIPQNTSNERRSFVAPKHDLDLKLTIFSNTEYIKFNLNYENKSNNHKLQIVFNVQEPIKTTISEDLYKTVVRNFEENYNLQNLVPAPKGIELKQNTMPINRFVWTQNVGIITDGLKEIEILNNSMAVTLLRSIGIISNPQNPTRGTPAGPPIKTPEMQLIGKQSATLYVTFNKNPNKLFEICDKIFNPPLMFLGATNCSQFIKKDNDNIKITVIKKSYDDSLIVRLVNYSGLKEICTFNLPKKQIFESNLIEDKIIPTNNVLYFNPYEIKTIKITQ
jgi:alpha-mannosidase